MKEESVPALRQAVREANLRIERAAMPETALLLARPAALIDDLAADLEAHEALVTHLTESLAERLEDLMESLETASDMLNAEQSTKT